MGYKTKIQSIKRKNSEQFFINLPMAIAQSLEISAGEEIQWTITSDGHLLIERPCAISRTAVKKTKAGSVIVKQLNHQNQQSINKNSNDPTP